MTSIGQVTGKSSAQSAARQPPPARSRGRTILLITGLALVAFNLRPALSSLAPVLPQAIADYQLHATMAGILTTLPVLFLGIFGVTAARLGRRFGTEMVVMASLIVLALGCAVRVVPSATVLLVGVGLAGIAIGIVNVLLPSLVKRDFDAHAGPLMGLYTMMLCLGAAAGSGFTVPLERSFQSWQWALAAWAVPALACALVWAPQILSRPYRPPSPPGIGAVWRNPLAWQVTGFMGLQSALAYIVIGWLPVMLQDLGHSPLRAGFIASISLLVQSVTALIVPPLAARRPSQRPFVVIVLGTTAIAFAVMAFAPAWLVWPAALCLGFGLGGCFGLALTVIVLRSHDEHIAAELSAMAQSVGYVIASAGPFLAGLLRGWSGGWSLPAGLFLCLTGLAMLVGLGAARNAHVRLAG